MNREEIIRLAQESDIEPDSYHGWLGIDDLERFANLIIAAEREACAQACELVPAPDDDLVAARCAAAIRARTKAEMK